MSNTKLHKKCGAGNITGLLALSIVGLRQTTVKYYRKYKRIETYPEILYNIHMKTKHSETGNSVYHMQIEL